MRSVILTAVVAASVACRVVQAQAPLPPELVSARRVYLSSDGVERRWLDRLAEEFRKAKRFTLVTAPTDADAIVTLRRGKGVTVGIPLPGTGAFIATDNEAFHLTVTDAQHGIVWWDDTREASWTVGGAVTALSKRLHDELAKVDTK